MARHSQNTADSIPQIAEDEMENIISQVMKGSLSEAIQARLNARSEVLENEIEDLKNKIAIRMKAFESHDAADLEYIVQLLKNFQALKLEDFNTDPIQAKQVINAFIGEIVIKKDLECQIYPAKSSPKTQKWLRQLKIALRYSACSLRYSRSPPAAWSNLMVRFLLTQKKQIVFTICLSIFLRFFSALDSGAKKWLRQLDSNQRPSG